MATTALNYLTLPSALGHFGIVWSDSGAGLSVRRIFLGADSASTERSIGVTFGDIAHGAHPGVTELGEHIQGFLEGEARAFDLSLMALEACSEFQRRVLLADHAVPRGWVTSYGRIARRLRVRGGARAVGWALARNPFPIVIPCHRVIRADGTLGGFQGGVALKRILLAYEGVEVSEVGRVLNARVYY